MQELFRKPLFWALSSLILLLLIAAGFWYWMATNAPNPVQPSVAEPQPAPVSAPASDDNAIKHPLPPSPMTLASKDEADKDRANKLPPPDDSDVLVNELASQLLGPAPLAKFFQTTNLVRRLVAAIDNLPREKIASRLNPLKPIEGALATTGADDSLALSPGNFSRYAPFIDWLVTLDTRRIVDAYVRFYPLFQQEYKALGYPTKYFNDRVIEAIDDLLAAPDIEGQVRLVQPKVQYQFADPALESLSHGRKAMIRMGSNNAGRVKAKLRELRAALVAAAASRPKS